MTRPYKGRNRATLQAIVRKQTSGRGAGGASANRPTYVSRTDALPSFAKYH